MMKSPRFITMSIGAPVLLALGMLGEGNGDAAAAGIAKRIAAGAFHSCARLQADELKCWGYNLFGQLGLGDTVYRGDGPNEMGALLPSVKTGGRVQEVVAGYAHTCVRHDGGTVKCWGLNSFGQLGLGDLESRGDQVGEMGGDLPDVDLGTGRTAVQLAAGSAHTCALLDTGEVKCWGANGYGQLGLGDMDNRGDDIKEMGDYLPAVDLGKGKVLEIAAGVAHTCARLDTRVVKCWGFNLMGQLGLGDTNNRGDQPNEMGDNLPRVDLGRGRVALELAAGAYHSCARLENATLKCWGYNLQGELGLGDTNSRGDQPGEMGNSLPAVDFGVGLKATALAARYFHTCARLDDGALKCWGENSYGQLGLGDIDARGDDPGEMGNFLSPVDLGTAPSRASAFPREFAANGLHTCAWLEDPMDPAVPAWLKCWGGNLAGALGQGDTSHRGDQPNEMGDLLPPVELGAPPGF